MEGKLRKAKIRRDQDISWKGKGTETGSRKGTP